MLGQTMTRGTGQHGDSSGRGLAVGYFGPELVRGGAPEVMVEVANAVAAGGSDMHLFLSRSPDEDMAARLSHGVKVHLWNARPRILHRGPWRRLGRRLTRAARLVCVVNREKLNCVIADIQQNVHDATLLRALGILRVPVIARLGTLLSRKPGCGGRGRRLRVTYRYADAVVVPSRMAKADAQATLGLPSARIHVIENCIDSDRIHRLSFEPTPEASGPVLLYVGDLAEGKDLPTLVRAAEVLTHETGRDGWRSSWVVWIVGDGPQREQLQRMVGERGLTDRFVFFGFQANPWSFMRRARVFVATSIVDGFMLSLVEAAAIGVPVVYPDYGVGAGDYLREAGIGKEFRAECGDSLAHAIQAELDLPCRLDEDQAERISRMFGRDRFAARYRELIASTCCGPRRRVASFPAE